ncbi:MAG: response regulator transcription factor [Anaerolineae bacterium]|nr:response regulator transcription factor [Anaerolineae bacterium]
MTTILVVDDEESIRKPVIAYLEAEGYTVRTATDGQQALRVFQRYKPQLVILDVMLPGMDGFEVLQHIRRESDAYVLMLTAKSEETDRIVGLTIGADDYVTKPFSPRELVARVKAILRRDRNAAAESSNLNFAHIRIDSQRHQVWRDDEDIDLTALEFELLKTLATYPGMVLSRAQLLEKVWGYDFYGDERVVDVHIGRIRQKLETNPAEPQFVQTVRGVGYRFEDELL